MTAKKDLKSVSILVRVTPGLERLLKKESAKLKEGKELPRVPKLPAVVRVILERYFELEVEL